MALKHRLLISYMMPLKMKVQILLGEKRNIELQCHI